jgi:hypothetical protein
MVQAVRSQSSLIESARHCKTFAGAAGFRARGRSRRIQNKPAICVLAACRDRERQAAEGKVTELQGAHDCAEQGVGDCPLSRRTHGYGKHRPGRFRQLAKEDSPHADASLQRREDRAQILYHPGNLYRWNQRYKDAMTAYSEALPMLRGLNKAFPKSYGDTLGDVLLGAAFLSKSHGLSVADEPTHPDAAGTQPSLATEAVQVAPQVNSRIIAESARNECCGFRKEPHP